MRTSQPSSRGLNNAKHRRPTLFAVGSPARTSVTLDPVPALKASRADYGLTSPRPFATFDPAGCSWRTPLGSLLEGWTAWSRTWPQAGMTRNGTAYRLRPSAPRTYGHACSYWPTLVATETKRGSLTPYSQGGSSLTYALGGTPNPMWAEWFMGFPPGWTRVSAPSEMPSFPKSPSMSDG